MVLTTITFSLCYKGKIRVPLGVLNLINKKKFKSRLRRKLRDNFLEFKRKTQSRQAVNLSTSLKEGDKGREKAVPFELDTQVSHVADKQSQTGEDGFRERVKKSKIPEKHT